MRLAQSDQEEAAVRARLADREEQRKRQFEADVLLETNGVPPKYRGAKFDGLKQVPAELREKYHAATEDLRSLLVVPGGIIVLMGPRGTGKTHMACALVNTFCRDCRHAVYAEAMDYFLRLDEQINARGSVLKVEAQFLRPKLLALDAMEERADTPAKDRMLTRLIDKRYAANLATVLVTNETKEKFVERVGPSVADRIRDDGQIVVCDWKSLRGRIVEPTE